MECESHSFEKIEEKQVAVNCDDGNMGSGEKSLNSMANGSRPASTPISGPQATIPTPDQLTIFYGGKVLVFDEFPAEKAHEIMLIAATAATVKPADMNKAAAASPASRVPILTRAPSLQSATSALPSPQSQHYHVHQGFSLCKLQAELPITRKHSLQRFFEKRRDRLSSKSPYPTPPAKMDDAKKPDISAEVSKGDSIAQEREIQMKGIQPAVATDLSC